MAASSSVAAKGLVKSTTWAGMSSRHRRRVLEARSAGLSDLDLDALVPQTGRLVYDGSDLVPQGLGPVIVRDHGATTPDDLSDAAVPVGQGMSISAAEITISVDGTSADPPGLELSYSHDPPATDYDVGMERESPSWMSPAIWVDNQSDGYDEEEGRDPAPSRERVGCGVCPAHLPVAERRTPYAPDRRNRDQTAYLSTVPVKGPRTSMHR